MAKDDGLILACRVLADRGEIIALDARDCDSAVELARLILERRLLAEGKKNGKR